MNSLHFKITALVFTLSVASLALDAEPATNEQTAHPMTPVVPAAGMAGLVPAGSIPNSSAFPSMQSGLTAEEGKILGKARMELQKDPELLELNAQIKALMDKRMKLTEEKLQKIDPEAAAIMQKLKVHQEKMIAERKAQMEAMQAKYNAQQEATKAAAAKPVAVPAATPSPVKPTVTATPSP